MLKWLRNNALGTHLFTRRHGVRAGEDEQGNLYYRHRGSAKHWRDERRWVVYKNDITPDGSLVPPGWNAWLHKNLEMTPSEQPMVVRRFEQEHLPNLSGTAFAYLPPGHEKRGGQRDHATGDYEAWRPE